jgi:hypothetical protein
MRAVDLRTRPWLVLRLFGYRDSVLWRQVFTEPAPGVRAQGLGVSRMRVIGPRDRIRGYCERVFCRLMRFGRPRWRGHLLTYSEGSSGGKRHSSGAVLGRYTRRFPPILAGLLVVTLLPAVDAAAGSAAVSLRPAAAAGATTAGALPGPDNL